MPPSGSGRPGSRDTDVERILDLVPLATHNQRGRGTLVVGTESRLRGEELVGIVERSMSSPIFELLKRADELFVVEHAHLRRASWRTSVRHMLRGVLDVYGGVLDDDDFVRAPPGELRDDPRPRRARRALRRRSARLRHELATGERAPRRPELSDWLQNGV